MVAIEVKTVYSSSTESTGYVRYPVGSAAVPRQSGEARRAWFGGRRQNGMATSRTRTIMDVRGR